MRSIFVMLLMIVAANGNDQSRVIESSMGLKMIQISQEGDDKFWISETEVTRFQWATISGETLPDIADREKPKANISLLDALRLSAFLTKRDRSSGLIGNDLVYCVPTVEQWRLAAGEEQGRNLPFEASEADNFAVYGMSPNSSIPSVKSKNPNKFGLFDIHGSLFEWTISFSSPVNKTGDDSLFDMDCMVVGGAYFSDLVECGFRSSSSTQIDKRIQGVGVRLTLIKTSNPLFKNRSNIVGVRSGV